MDTQIVDPTVETPAQPFYKSKMFIIGGIAAAAAAIAVTAIKLKSNELEDAETDFDASETTTSN